MTTKVNYNKLATDEAIAAAIGSLHNRAESMQLDVHKVLVAICAKWNATKDKRGVAEHINLLLSKDKLGGLRTNAIREWVETFMGLMVIADGDDKGKFMVPADKKAGQHLQMDVLVNKRWWEFKPEAPYQPLDFDKQWDALAKKARTRLAAGVKDEDNIDAGMIAAMNKARAEYLASKN